MIASLIFIILAMRSSECVVLDPALYLSPSPPLKLASDGVPPEILWARSVEAQTERNARDVYVDEEIGKEDPPKLAAGRMFWPRFSSPQPALGIHIPLTFSLSGTYGKVASPTGAIPNIYSSVTGSLGNNLGFGRSALAGSSYGSYGSGVRVFGGDNTAAWSGWGNGKWGHYGKG